MDNYNMCADSNTAIEILEFIKQKYVKHDNQAGVKKYIDALQMGIDALRKPDIVKCFTCEFKGNYHKCPFAVEVPYREGDFCSRGFTRIK